jgi:uncharacterized repeat protein (TIGR03803 family)
MKTQSTSATGRLLLALAFALSFAAVASTCVQAQEFSVVYNFTGGSDGANPLNGFVTDGAGNVYGSASSGGASNNGVVFRFNSSGETVLYNFNGGSDGSSPQGVLIRDAAGNLYGTTFYGGVSNSGTVYGINPAGEEEVLYSFTGAADGGNPQAGLARDSAGNLYGTTTAGGANHNGTVFELTRPKKNGQPWIEQALYSFGAAPDGATPVAGVTFDHAGNLYGTTSAGGAYGYGTIFQLVPAGSNWTENILHEFQNADDGAVPYAGLVLDKAGNLFGAATEGDGGSAGGTVFELTPSNGSWNFNLIYTVAGWGISGTFRDVLLDSAGNLYATTHCDGQYDAGTVYRLTPADGSWTYTSLYVFTGGTDGLYSFSNLVVSHGSLYGTTNQGGANGYGVIFKIAP